MAGEIGHAAAVAPFVVVPGENLELGAIHHHRGEAIDDRAATVVHVIHRHQRPFFVTKNSLEGASCRCGKCGIHLIHINGPLQFKHRIGEGGIQQRHPHGMAVELALQLGEDHADGLGGSRGGGDQGGEARAGPA